MDPITSAQNPELETAEEKLSRMEAAQAAETASPTVTQIPKDEALKTEDRPSDADKEVESKVPEEKSDTPSETEVQPEKALEEKPAAEQKTDKQEAVKLSREEEKKFSQWLKQSQTKYAADMAKRLVRWDAIKQQEQAVLQAKTASEQALAAQKQQLESEMQAWKQEQEAQKPSPEKYEAWAAQQMVAADQKIKEADKLENDGEFDKAEALRDEAKFLKRDAASAIKTAENQRKNPPELIQQKSQEQFIANQKEWVNKAAIDFPEFAKKDSQVQKDAAAYYNQIVASDPSVTKLPGFVYFCAERASLKSAADRVPGLTKELTETKKRLSQLEAMTNPSPSGGVTKMPSGKSYLDLSPEEQFNQLKQDASVLY